MCVVHGAWLVYTRGVYAALLPAQLYVSVGHIEIVIGLMAIANCALSFYSLTRQLRCFVYAVSGGQCTINIHPQCSTPSLPSSCSLCYLSVA
jgi:hypothetical protein